MAYAESITRKIVRIPALGVPLEAALEVPRPARGVVLFAHASASSRMNARVRFLALALRRAGLATLLFDLLTEAEDREDGRRCDVGLLAGRLREAVRWTRRRPATSALPIGLFGAATGAAAALEVAAGGEPSVAALVLRDARLDLAAPAALAANELPTLLLVRGEDAAGLARAEAGWKRMRCPKFLRAVPGAGAAFEEPGAMEAVASLASGWFSRHLRAQSPGMESATFFPGLAEFRP